MQFSKHSVFTRRQSDIAYGKAVAEKVASFRPDVVISANMPLDAQKILQRAARKQNAKFVFWVQDVYSFAVRFVLDRKLSPLVGMAVASYYRRMEKKLLCNSDVVVCIAPDFKKIVTAWGVRPERAFMIENWAPLNEVRHTNKDNAWAREHNLQNRFCFMYSGTLGMKHRPELLLALARELETTDDAQLVVIASDAGADWLQKNAKHIRKNTLTLLPYQPYERLSDVLGASDVLIAMLDSEAGAFSVPSKILTYLCAGRPLLLAAPCENHAVAVIKQADAGTVVSPDCSADFVNAAMNLMENATQRNIYAANARTYAERMFNITSIADQFIEVFSQL
jgi:glycosyltransferase involved in cell wall biosynthesis